MDTITAYMSALIRNTEVSAQYPRIVGIVTSPESAKEAIKQGADILEVRADLMPQSEAYTRTKNIRHAIEKPLIGTIRKMGDFGEWYDAERRKPDGEARYALFTKLIPFVDAVDIEFNSEIRKDVIALAREHKKAVILSYHNCAYTPEREKIAGQIEKMSAVDCDIIKIAYMPCEQKDVGTLMTVLQDFKQEKPIAVATMGIIGYPARYVAPWFGSCLAYGVIEPAETMPLIEHLQESLQKARKHATLPLREGDRELEKILAEFPS